MTALARMRADIWLAVIVVATLWGAVAASAWGGWWHLTWIIPGALLLRCVWRDWPVDDRRKGMQ